MHPKEFKKIKNGTGHFTHLSLKNSELFIGIDFTNHKEVNKIIATHESYLLYPSKDAINLSTQIFKSAHSKNKALFILDATWACSIKMLRESKNLQALPSVTFSNVEKSQFKIKEQPEEYCLSTIESTFQLLNLLDKWGIENFKTSSLSTFLQPFHKMVEYQLKCINDPKSNAVRYKKK